MDSIGPRRAPRRLPRATRCERLFSPAAARRHHAYAVRHRAPRGKPVECRPCRGAITRRRLVGPRV